MKPFYQHKNIRTRFGENYLDFNTGILKIEFWKNYLKITEKHPENIA